ncbi:Serine/threonine-protein kinase AfsK [Lignipirellula cremea]|uniref:Serine/threonine-protein kinase AfsK n=2 Tax=Lignipirellula cremea TaxID=2528010 RepID=A0A518DZ55_9BACT|nr:Serine/threonine-protein kinase AfsK [Lignipirellula cremea]
MALPTQAQWPAYRADASRSGISRTTITLPLRERWRLEAQQKPAPAWPDPVKEAHRLDFDAGPQLVVAEGAVFFGSSADDTLRAVDARTGRVRWSFTTGGPIRFAPAVDQGRVYAASDDGYLYCLDAAQGDLLWKFHAAGRDDRVLGNGRFISRWPLRSGVLVDGGVAYLTAGMWPSEGVMIYALDAESGKVKWCNDTADALYLAQPHAKAYSLTGVSPQGYLLANKELLFVPTGRGAPAAFDRQTGELRYFRPAESKTHGGCWATLAGPRLFNGGLVYTAATGDQIACPTPGVPLWAKEDFDFGTRQKILGYRGQRILADGEDVLGRRSGYCLALAGNLLLEGSEGALTAYDRQSKQAQTVLWETQLPGGVRSIAVSDAAVFAATDRGDVYCFEHQAETDATLAPAATHAPAVIVKSLAASPFADAVVAAAELANLSKGYALVVGDAALAESLVERLSLHVVCLLESDAEIARVRARLVASGVYGAKISVQSVDRLRNGDCPAFFANLIVVDPSVENVAGEEVWRLLRPCGGVLCFLGSNLQDARQKVASVEDPPEARGELKGLAWLRRGKLPGAFDWDSPSSADQRVRWPLELAWFGGPGPARMQDRHQTSIAPPVVANGRYFVAGEQQVIAVDAYNGVELWSHAFVEGTIGEKSAVRLEGLAADDQFVYYRLGEDWRRLDAQSGEKLSSVAELPAGLHPWGRPSRRDEPFAMSLRAHALTKESVPRMYYRAYGCNQVLAADGVDFFRSGTLGLYDLNDDSGLRNFGGVRPGCWRSHNAAFGVFLSSEGSSGCRCTYNFQTSLMLAPTTKRRHEDWAVYHDLPTNGLVRRMHLNLGAPGDRRDQEGRLWLAYPRPKQAITLQLPVAIDGGAAYHFDADRWPVQNTDQPWIYSSGYRGLRRVTIDLDQQQPLISVAQPASPIVDGQMAEGEWIATAQASLLPLQNRQNRGAPNRALIDPADWTPEVRFAHDDENLYVAFHQANRLDQRGKPYAWRKTTTGSNASVWSDDSCELFLSDTDQKTVLHFGVSASGATFDARLQPGDALESVAWDAPWKASVAADDEAFLVELAIPFQTLREAGLSPSHLLANLQTNWAGWSMPLRFLGSRGRRACENFSPLGLGVAPPSPRRRFHVRLHFADPDADPDSAVADKGPFAIQIQGKTVRTAFTPQAAVGQSAAAIVAEFSDIGATDSLTIDFVPSNGQELGVSLSGIEIEEQAE